MRAIAKGASSDDFEGGEVEGEEIAVDELRTLGKVADNWEGSHPISFEFPPIPESLPYGRFKEDEVLKAEVGVDTAVYYMIPPLRFILYTCM